MARVLAQDPTILVLDEFSTGLDQATVARILDRLRANRTLILITHDAEVAGFADRKVALEAGRVLADGTPSDIAMADRWFQTSREAASTTVTA